MAKITPEIVVKAFMSTKGDIEDLKGKIKQLEEVQGKRLTWMQTFLQKTGQLSSKTPFGTFVKKNKSSVRVQDWTAARNWIIENGKWEFLNSAVNKTAVLDMFKGTKELPPGVGLETFVEVSVTKNRKPSNQGEM